MSLESPIGHDSDSPPLGAMIAGAAPDGEMHALSRELALALAGGLAQLSGEQRQAFVMREVDQMTFPGISEVLGVNEATVKSRMRYAVKGLRQSLEGFGGQP